MKQVIIITFITTLIHSTCQGIFSMFYFKDWNIEAFEYPFMFTLVIFTVPIFISVVFSRFVFLRLITTKNKFFKVVFRIFFILCIILSGLICWTLLDMQFRDFDYTYTFTNLYRQFNEAYLEFVPMALLIPLLILFTAKKLKAN